MAGRVAGTTSIARPADTVGRKAANNIDTGHASGRSASPHSRIPLISSSPHMSEPEVWLRGALPDVAPLLQPVAHSLLQCRLEVRATVPTLADSELWATPGGAASAGYHVRHAIGSLDRLFTYARGEQLSSTQIGRAHV